MTYEKLLIRLEIIKNLIVLKENDEIISQIEKLKTNPYYHIVEEVINKIEKKQYEKASQTILEIIAQSKQVAVLKDTKIDSLVIELKNLEKLIVELSNQKNIIEKEINNFNQRYNKEFGDLILKILELKKKCAKSENEKADAESDFNSYNDQFNISQTKKDISNISEEQKSELKKKYRKAATFCHPDKVSEIEKEAAEEMFGNLQQAYEQNDLETVNKILVQLENGNLFKANSETITDLDKLQIKINQLKNKLEKLYLEIKTLEKTEVYSTINQIKDFESYFVDTKIQFEKQLKELIKYGC